MRELGSFLIEKFGAGAAKGGCIRAPTNITSMAFKPNVSSMNIEGAVLQDRMGKNASTRHYTE